MEAYHPDPLQQHTRTSHLSQLYSDVKKSADSNLNVRPAASEQHSGLHLKYRIQTDRLITWGLAWSEEGKGTHVDIDDSVARAGLTETVDSVLRNIKDVTEEAERIKSGTTLGSDGDNKIALVVQPAKLDAARYEDLLRDLTASIDTLYDLSHSRRALARGEHPSFDSAHPLSEKSGTPSRSSIYKAPSFSSFASTLINPSYRRPALSPYAGLPPRIDISALRLPYEGPPPYEALGVPSSTRLVAQLIRARVAESVQNSCGSTAAEIPVLIDYANFDSIYRDTHVPPPLQRLEALASYFQPMRSESQTNLSLLGYFEDLTQPRIGLVYDMPYSLQNRLQGNVTSAAPAFTSVSLLKLVQKSAKSGTPANSDVAAPALEYRYRLALRLTEQLAELHSREMYHGNINSNSVLFTMAAGGTPAQLRPDVIRSPLWASFDLFSKCTVEGVQQDINLNIYRHPRDLPQSDKRDLFADIRFDIYSLSLILLEIGLWIPIGDLYKAKYSLADFKLRLEKLYIPKLAAKCGTTYMRLVETGIRFADDASGTGMTTPGLYDHLLEKLRMCALLDEDDISVNSLTNDAHGAGFQTTSQSTSRKPLPRHQSDLTGQSRTTASSQSHRLGSGNNIAFGTLSHANTSPLPQRGLSPQPSLRSQMAHSVSASDVTGRAAHGFATAPSFKQYKQKIVTIQQRWREHRARCLDAIWEQNRQLSEAQTNDNQMWETEEKPIEVTAKSKRREFPSLQLPQPLMDEWHNRTARQLGNLVERALNGSLESSSISLTAYGETVETARPTLLICCKSTAKVKHMLKRHFKYDPAMFDVRVKRDEIRRCAKSRQAGYPSKIRRSMAPYGGFGKAKNPDYQERPFCGASIGAYRDDEHLPPVSFGGIVLVDGMPYGMSVHHMLEADEDDETDAEASDEADDDNDDDTSSIGSSDDESVFSHSDDEDTVRPPSTIPDLETFNTHDGDMPGVMPEDYEEIAITQPALDDAIDCDLHVDEEDEDSDEDSGIDEDHLLSYKVGQIHASSGLRRTAQSTHDGFKSISQSLSQEIDWALFELVPPRAQPFNIVRGGKKYCPTGFSRGRDSCPVAIRNSTELACAKVHCLGRTSGLATGVISSTMELVKIHGRSTFSASWTVDGSFGVGGDSGAWVISNDDGRVCGHVLASRRGRTYICPMDLLLNDIKQTLGASVVELPAAPGRDLVKAPIEMERSFIEEAVGKMRIPREQEYRPHSSAGGVLLPSPSSPPRRSMQHNRFHSRPDGSTVETAG